MVPSPHLGGDNGPEFVARALLKWLADQGIETALIDLSCSGDVDPGLEPRTATGSTGGFRRQARGPPLHPAPVDAERRAAVRLRGTLPWP